jgi:hypothetical protein
MALWWAWFRCVQELRGACTRRRTFMWMSLVLAGLSMRADLAGVSSLVRVLGLKPKVYRRLLHLFHTPGLDLGKLTGAWTELVLRVFTPLRLGNRLVLIGDGLKVAKEGKKMPAVKKLHQSSQNNSKPTYIFGHSFQALGLLVCGPLGHLCCVPLTSRIHEGVVFTNRDRRTLLDKFVQLFLELVGSINAPSVLIVDAYLCQPQSPSSPSRRASSRHHPPQRHGRGLLPRGTTRNTSSWSPRGCMAKKCAFAIYGVPEPSSLLRLPVSSMASEGSCYTITRSIYFGDLWVSWCALSWSSILRAGV